MSYIINLLEALIVSYGLVELCKVSNRKMYFITNVLISFIVIDLFDYIDQNFISLIVFVELMWFVIVSLFARKILFHNLYVVTMINLICSLSASLPIMFIYQYDPLYAGLTAKAYILHLLLGLLSLEENMNILKIAIGY